MPCVTYPPSGDEIVNRKLRALADEVGFPLDQLPSGLLAENDHITAKLCLWCKMHDVTAQSLELQIWWRDHQIADKRQAEEMAAMARRSKLITQALAKLTPDERQALGWMDDREEARAVPMWDDTMNGTSKVHPPPPGWRS